MKVSIIFLTVVSVALGAAVQPRGMYFFHKSLNVSNRANINTFLVNGNTLPEAFAEIAELMNFEAFKDEIAIWIEKDAEVAAVYNYFSSDNFSAAWDVVSASESIIQFVRWVESTGVDIIGFFNRIAVRFGLKTFVPAQPISQRSINSRSWESFVEAILALYPQEEFHALVTELKITNEEFAQFIWKFGYMEGSLKLIAEYPEVQQVGADLRELGVDVDRILEALRNFFEWE